jgi:methyl-accepting chemotaxis protein
MFNTMRMGTKVLAGFGAAVVIALVVGGAGYTSAANISKELDDVANADFPGAQALAKIDEAQTATARNVNALFIERADRAMREKSFADLRAAFQRMDEGWSAYEGLPRSDEATAVWRAMATPWGEWRRAMESTQAALERRERLLERGVTGSELTTVQEECWEAFTQARGRFDAATSAISKVHEQTAKDVASGKAQAEAAVRAGNTTIALAIALGAALLLAIGVFLSRSVGAVIRSLLSESGKLTDAVKQGRLTVRGDAPAVNFEFRGIVEGMNATMDAFAKPIAVTADYVDRISKGDIPPKITDTYEGDFNAIKQNLNQCIDAVAALVQDSRGLAEAAVAGKLSTRADASRHQGDFRRIVEGVNHTLDAVLGPITEAATVLEKLAARDLRARVKGSYEGDHARIKDALNATADALHDALAQVAQAVEQVSSASAQIASSAQSVADGASEQASSLEETSSQLESMAATSKVATDNAMQANGLAQQAKGAATDGAAAMDQMSGAMGKIRASAEGTSQIIKDINEIAFQTNLLALNAAVEAARAGEAGRGFAVVAEEVRSLALRSKEAATKTEELIRQSVKEASDGEVTSRHVSAKLAEIVSGVTKVTDIVAEITASAKEQVQGIAQVNTAVAQMDKVTQQNAANSEESSSAAQELSAQSEELAAMVGTFQLERAVASAARVSAPAVRATARSAPSRPAPAAPAKAPKAKNGAHGNGALALRPEQIIPLDSESFQEF